MVDLRYYLELLKAETDIHFSDSILKMNLQYMLDNRATAVLDGDHVRLHEIDRIDFKYIDDKSMLDDDSIIIRHAILHNYEYEPELEKKFSHVYVYITKEELADWIEKL